MSADAETKVQERLRRLRKPEPKASPFRIYGPYAAVLAAGLGIGGYVASLPAAEQAKPAVRTSEVAEFQQDLGLAGFSTRTPHLEPAVETPKPAPEKLIDPAAKEEAGRLRQELADLQAEIQELKKRPAESPDGLTNLQAEMQSLKAAATERDSVYAELERENIRLQTQLGTSNMLGLPDAGMVDEDAQRLAELEARRAAAEALRAARNASPMVAYRAGGGSSAPPDNAASTVAGEVEGQSGPGDESFVRAGATHAEVTHAEVIANPSRTVVQGTLIEATLQTAIQSSLEGNIIATVSRDVWSMDMANVAIPRGSKLFGRYSSDIARGQRRVLVAWDRVVTPDGQTADLAAYGTDRIGRSGLTGRVRNHTLARFAGAAAVSVIGGLPAIITAALEDGSEGDSRHQAWNDAASNVAQGTTSVLGELMQGYLDIPTTLSINQGAIVMVQVNADVEML
ncbi:TrbI/VirB10 family protein [Paracoccus sp. CPCC 101403]|uniref:TrbI/VirB10 family protein n=1 Tax=Paracoccus broussonetiae TaxID=3075834 RepID=A0ABU3EKC7_9RHOB|nr:TrbI/VirB10 family protein [Paracoccus sp. CPCC 101403]MDT1064694.1 TrbI/VirB10 family protein [Paracoccus sp. CPCC 101403]